ncbi:hypothetical protein Fot_29092 [Forsythia ovata]|uniref:Uncharacterized protein n=1 Tax=Forsythia ovata TaxID=205694 RepID=A0ABD1TQT5_9LAMI
MIQLEGKLVQQHFGSSLSSSPPPPVTSLPTTEKPFKSPSACCSCNSSAAVGVSCSHALSCHVCTSEFNCDSRASSSTLCLAAFSTSASFFLNLCTTDPVAASAALGSAFAFFQPTHAMVTASLPLSGAASAVFGYKKKFLDPNSISFSFLSKLVHTTQLISIS